MAKNTFQYLILSLSLITSTLSTTTAPKMLPCPSGCKCSDNNLIVDCSHRGLMQPPLISGPVQKLDLSHNLFSPMINGSFERLRHLQEINLSSNGLSRLQLCTFTGLLHLRRVDLHNNRLISLPTGLFADNGDLEELDLSHNAFEYLPDILFHSVPMLKVLNISHNHIMHLQLGLRFQILTRIQTLDFSHNPVRNISRLSFDVAKSWEHTVHRALDLSYCQLEAVNPLALKDIPGLKSLSLSGNRLLPFAQVTAILQELDGTGLESLSLSNMSITNPDLFSAVTLTALKYLDLSANSIAVIANGTFGNIRSLQYLDVSCNNFTGLDSGFGDLVNLQVFNISHCRLESFKGDAVSQMQHLHILDLSHNRLQNSAEVVLSPLQQLRILDLSFNALHSLTQPGDNQHLITFKVASNRLTSLPSMSNMQSLRYFEAQDNNLQTLGPFLFTEARGILVANFSRNDITSIDSGAFHPFAPEIIDLSSNLLTNTEYYRLTRTREVYLQDNKINHLQHQTFYGMDNLQVLNLSKNNISMIQDDTFKFLQNLTTLSMSHNIIGMTDFFPLLRSLKSLETFDLSHNQIEIINSSSFLPLVSLKYVSLSKNKLRTIPAELFETFDNVTQVDISGNPFHCGCELLPLQKWLQRTNVKVIEHYNLNVTNMCHSPSQHAGKMVTQYTVTEFECNTTLLYMIIFGSLGGLGIIVGILISLICHYHPRFQKTHHGYNSKQIKRIKAKDALLQEKQAKKVDLVRWSRHSDKEKQELINGWIASKHLAEPRKSGPHNTHRSSAQDKQGPPRPPWPVRISNRSGKKERERKEISGKHDERENVFHVDRHTYPNQYGMDSKFLRYLCENPQTPVWEKQQLMQEWKDHYREDPRRAMARLPPQHDYWYQARGGFPMWARSLSEENARYYTIPSPSYWQRPAYGPYYPYRRGYAEEKPYTPRSLPHIPTTGPQITGVQSRVEATEIYTREPHQYAQGNYAGTEQADHRYPRQYIGGQGRHISTDAVRGKWPEGDNYNDYPKDARRNTEPSTGNRYDYHKRPEHPAETTQDDDIRETAGRNVSLKRGRNEQEIQVPRRDSEYRNAMENPVIPKSASSPLIAGDKTSDWL